MICKNCKNDFEGNFCNNCGQKRNVQKVNLNYLIDEISNSFFQVNRGIFFTLKELSIRPGKSINDFLNGKRKQHYKPLAFVLLTSTIYIIVAYFFGKKTYLGAFFSGFTEGISANPDEKELLIFQNSLDWLSNNFTYFTLLILPLFSFASYIFFIKTKYNYFEHLILNFYITGQQTIIYIVFYLLFMLFKIDIESSYLASSPIILSLLYGFWSYITFFKKKKIFSTITLTILTYILFWLLLMVVSILTIFLLKII